MEALGEIERRREIANNRLGAWCMMGTIARRVIWLIPVLLWTGLIFHFSSQPYKEQSIQPFLHSNVSAETAKEILPDMTVHYRNTTIPAKKAPYEFIEFFFRKGSHLFVYFMLAGLGFTALYPYKGRLAVKLAFVLLLVTGVAMLDEWNQSRTSGRTPAIQDVGIDLSGGAAGLGTAVVLFRIAKGKFKRA